jgi:general stress protein 26
MGKNERSKIVMGDDEIVDFIDHSRTATMATVGPNGRPHLIAMWYAVLDGEVWFETKAKSQKAVNLRRRSR